MMELPYRRMCLRYEFNHRGFRYEGTIGFDPRTLQPVDIFLQTAKSGTDVEALARDAAVLASKALQHGASIDELRSAMTRLEADAPAGPVAVLLDIFSTDMARRALA